MDISLDNLINRYAGELAEETKRRIFAEAQLEAALARISELETDKKE